MEISTAGKEALTDEEVIAQMLQGRINMYEHIMRKYNQRLFRICRSILHDEDDAEDALQEGYINAYQQIASFRGASAFATWLTRIVINQALKKNKENQRFVNHSESYNSILKNTEDMHTPDRALMMKELKTNLEKCISSLPESYRTVYIMREVEKMSVAETSACLDISEVNVKVRLNRAKEKLRKKLSEMYTEIEVFEFHLIRCDRIVANVLARISH